MFTATDTFQSVDVPVRITGVDFSIISKDSQARRRNGIELHAVIDITFDSTFTLSAFTTIFNYQSRHFGNICYHVESFRAIQFQYWLFGSGLPSGATASFSPSSITAPVRALPPMDDHGGRRHAVSTYNLVVNGTGGGQTHSVTINLTVGNGDSSTQQLLGNPGFENGSANPSPWTVTSGVIDNSTTRAPHTGSWKAWPTGSEPRTPTPVQEVSIPANSQRQAFHDPVVRRARS